MASKECPACNARFRGDIDTCPIDGTPLAEPADEFIGATIAGRYLVEELIGSGGMARVYRARHQVIGRHVALKFLEPDLAQHERQRKRFLGEARAANQISHENIIDITDYGETEDGAVYMVMEYLEGRTLESEIDRGPLGVQRSLHVAEQVARGLARAHELGVIHRDVKPANIFLTDRGQESDFVKLLDFGIARIEHDMRITAAGTLVGTPEYIAPEQVRSGNATAATDMYALGCVLFEMLTGELPFEGGTSMLLIKHLNDPPPIPSQVRHGIPREVDDLVLTMLAKEAEHRHRDAFHLADELQALLRSVPGARHSRPTKRKAAKETEGPSAIAYEEAGWQRALAMFSALVREAHPAGDAPDWLTAAIRQMAALTTEVHRLRENLEAAGKRATEREQVDAEPRKQIGFALDHLAHDESKVSRAINQLEADISQEELRLNNSIGSVLKHARAVRRPIPPDVALSAQDANQLNEMLQATEALGETRGRVAGLRAQLDARNLERRDLVFQIASLKDKLTSFHTARTTDLDIVHEEVNLIDGQIRGKLESGAKLAARVSAYFNGFPELRERMNLRAAGR